MPVLAAAFRKGARFFKDRVMPAKAGSEVPAEDSGAELQRPTLAAQPLQG